MFESMGSPDAGYSMTDAIVCCMQQPGALAVAFVELKSGRAIAGDGTANIDIDELTPWLTSFVLFYMNSPEAPLNDILLTTGDRIHLMHPLSGENNDLYLYMTLDRKSGNAGMGQRCLRDIAANLHL